MKILEDLFIKFTGLLAVIILILLAPILLAAATLKTIWSFCKGGYERIEREQRNW